MPEPVCEFCLEPATACDCDGFSPAHLVDVTRALEVLQRNGRLRATSMDRRTLEAQARSEARRTERDRLQMPERMPWPADYFGVASGPTSALSETHHRACLNSGAGSVRWTNPHNFTFLQID